MEYRYILEKYKNLTSRHTCPKCGKKELTFYIDTETGEPIHPTVGRCNREANCGYHYTAKQYFTDNKIFAETLPPVAKRTSPFQDKPKPVSYIDFAIFEASLKNYDNNNFVKFLTKTFGEIITKELIVKYKIGTSKHWNGATVFYQMDNDGKIRAGKIMLYDAETGKRIKLKHDHITWLHSLLKTPDFSLTQCLHGLHLIKDTTKPIALCESEKTSIIASVYLPQFIWVATGGSQNLRAELFTEVRSRRVILFPDLKCFDLWSEKAKTLGLSNYTVSDLLERKASEEDRQQGFDIADYLLKYNYQELRLRELIQMQWKHLHHECWDLSKPYDLQVSCDWLNANHKMNISQSEYYKIYQSLN
jgi:hypothetical protein